MTESAHPPLPAPLPWVGRIRTLIVFGVSLAAIGFSFGLTLLDNSAPDSRPNDSLSFLLLLGGVVGVLVGVILALYSWYHTRRLTRTLTSKKLLAHWTVSGDHWARYIANERRRASRESLWLILFIVGTTLLIALWSNRQGAGDNAWTWDDVLGVAGVMSGFSAITWIITQIRLYLLQRQPSGAIYITTDGVLLNRRWHSWWQLGRRLDNVTYERDPHNELVFIYSKPGPNHRQTTVELRVPVPPRHSSDARRLVARFGED